MTSKHHTGSPPTQENTDHIFERAEELCLLAVEDESYIPLYREAMKKADQLLTSLVRLEDIDGIHDAVQVSALYTPRFLDGCLSHHAFG